MSSPRTEWAPEEALERVPEEGDEVIIECQGQRWRALVGQKAPRGDFSVSWYGGRNPHHEGFVGHWCTDFGPQGQPKYGWRIVEVCEEKVGLKR